MGESSKVVITASRVVALIGILVLIRDSIFYFYPPIDVLAVLLGVVGLIIAFVVFDSLAIIDFKKLNIPYIWWVLLIIGFLLVLFEYLVGPSYLAGILVITAALIEILGQKKSYTASKIVVLIGAFWLIIESIMFIMGMGGSIALAIVGIIFAIILLLTLFDKVDIKVPYTWWVVLIIGFVIFIWVSAVSGTIIMVGFILILMAF